MEKILATYQFGPHRVDVVEDLDDDGQEYYLVLIDERVVTTTPLTTAPSVEDVVRFYAERQSAET